MSVATNLTNNNYNITTNNNIIKANSINSNMNNSIISNSSINSVDSVIKLSNTNIISIEEQGNPNQSSQYDQKGIYLY